MQNASQELLDMVTQLARAVPHAQAMVRAKFDIDEMSKRTEDALENHAASSNPTSSAERRGRNNIPALKREAFKGQPEALVKYIQNIGRLNA